MDFNMAYSIFARAFNAKKNDRIEEPSNSRKESLESCKKREIETLEKMFRNSDCSDRSDCKCICI